MKNSYLPILGATLLPLLIAGCTSTHIESRRYAAGGSAAPFRNITVVGMDSRPEVRVPFENNVVGYLQKHGVEGSASYTRFRFAELKGDKEAIRQRLMAAHVGSVLFVRVTDRTDFVTGPPASLGSMDMGTVNEVHHEALTVPGSDITSDWRIGAKLYRVSDGAVIWSCLLGTVMKEDSDSLTFMQGVAKGIVDQMAKDKVIP
jgi:hypothetical protein